MRIVLHRNFEKRIKKLPLSVREAYKAKRDVFLKNPFHPILDNHPLQGKYAHLRSINITSDYRVLYEPISDTLAHFMKIGTHAELYG